VDRRRFLLTSLAGALAVPLGVQAQRAGKVYRIGILSLNPLEASLPLEQAVEQGLRDRGHVEGRNATSVQCGP
jgi:hypothetical protein